MISEKTLLFCLSEREIGRAYFCPSAHETPAFGKRGGAAGACDRSAEGMADFRREKNGEVARNVALRRKKGPPGKGARRAMRPGKAQVGEGTGRGRHGRGMLLRAAQRCARGNVGARRRRPCGGCGNGTAMGWAATGQPRGDGDGAPCTKTRRAFSPPKSHGRRVSGQGRQRAAMERRGQRGAVKVAVRHGGGVPCAKTKRAFFPPCAAQKGRFRAGRAPSGACHGPSIGYLRKDGRTGRFSENNTLRTRRRGVTIWASFACPTAGFTFSFWAA